MGIDNGRNSYRNMPSLPSLNIFKVEEWFRPVVVVIVVSDKTMALETS
jgi:hypothetical protein